MWDPVAMEQQVGGVESDAAIAKWRATQRHSVIAGRSGSSRPSTSLVRDSNTRGRY